MKNKIIIYDDACPLCEWYTTAFIKYGLLDKDGRKPFSQIDQSIIAKIDLERACNEIPLVDMQTFEVLYGIDAMAEVLHNTFPFVKPIVKLSLVNWFLKKIYKLISYNRKGIVAKVPKVNGFTCAPSYNYNYKKYFIAFCFVIAILLMYGLFKKTFPICSDLVFGISGAMVLFGIFIQNKNVLEFIMQWQLQLMIICVMLIPAALLGQVSTLGALLFASIVAILFIKHIYHRILYLKYYFSLDK